MNIFHVALFLCVICYVYASEKSVIDLEQENTSVPVEVVDPIASSPKGIAFREAVQGKDMDAARYIFYHGDDKLMNYCGKYLISLESPKLVELIKSANFDNEVWLLRVVLIFAGLLLINQVFDAVKPSDNILGHVAESAYVACIPEKLTYLVKRITDKDGQEWAVTNGVMVLFGEKIEGFDPLLSALEDGTVLGQHLRNVAIHRVFKRASSNYSDVRGTLLGKRFFDHPAILVHDYSAALYTSHQNGGQTKEHFHWLLRRADHQDLEAVKRDYFFSKQKPEFQEAVDHALRVVGTDTRYEMGRKERITIISEALNYHVAGVLFELILGYYLEW